MTIKAGHYSHDIILFIEQDYNNKYLVAGDWSQLLSGAMSSYAELQIRGVVT